MIDLNRTNDTVIRLAAQFRLDGRMYRLELVYDAADPYAVALDIPAGAGVIKTWAFARELLNDGLVGHVDGPIGDVWIEPTVAGELRIELTSPEGHAVLWLRAQRVKQFLNAAYRLVPAGAEADQIDWDRELSELLAGIGGEW